MDENGTSLVPKRYVSPSAYNLGMNLSHVRSKGRFWKEKTTRRRRGERGSKTCGWRWNCHDSAWETFQKEMEAYVDENRTSLVPSKYVSPSKYKLGMMLAVVRSDGRLWKRKDDEGEEGVARKLERVDVELF